MFQHESAQIVSIAYIIGFPMFWTRLVRTDIRIDKFQMRLLIIEIGEQELDGGLNDISQGSVLGPSHSLFYLPERPDALDQVSF